MQCLYSLQSGLRINLWSWIHFMGEITLTRFQPSNFVSVLKMTRQFRQWIVSNGKKISDTRYSYVDNKNKIKPNWKQNVLVYWIFISLKIGWLVIHGHVAFFWGEVIGLTDPFLSLSFLYSSLWDWSSETSAFRVDTEWQTTVFWSYPNRERLMLFFDI